MASDTTRKQHKAAVSSEAGPFVLRTLLHDVPLSADGGDEDIKINCVDYLDGNLYVGTTASELLHFFRIPPDPGDPSSTAAFILASRLRPAYSESSTAPPDGALPGVQQILLLPRVGKACVLCNWTVTFYSLPELSPVFGTTQVRNCNWIGGVDLNEGVGDGSGGVTILLSLNRRIQVVRIGTEDARVVRKIDFAGSTLSVRRDSIACVADSRSYSLLDVDRQMRIPLMSISSLDESQPGGPFGQAQNVAAGPDGGLGRSASSTTARPLLTPGDAHGHARSTSLSGFITGGMRKQQERRNGGETEEPVFQDPESPAPTRSMRSPAPPAGNHSRGPSTADKPLPAPPSGDAGWALAAQVGGASTPAARTALPTTRPGSGSVFLKPHIVSPSAEEFLIVTGTSPLDPGIGMFVNLDGDPTRPTVEFDRYPREIAVDGGSPDLSSSTSRPSLNPEEEGYVLASLAKEFDDGLHHGLEIQRYDVNVGEGEPEKFWLEVRGGAPLGIRSMLTGEETEYEEIVDRLCQRRFSPFTGSPQTPTMGISRADSRTAMSIERLAKEKELFESDEEVLPVGWEDKRNKEGEDFVRRLAKASSRLAVWAGADIWWAVRNPLLLQLESSLESAMLAGDKQLIDIDGGGNVEVRQQLLAILDRIRGRDAKTELEFMTLGYIRQRASIMLLASFLNSPESPFSETEMKTMEENLLDGDLDARVVLSLIPALRNEIVVGRKGIWIYGGVKTAVESFIAAEKQRSGPRIPSVSSLAPSVLQFLRRFLAAWRKKKGFGSIADEIFRTVDASLLLVLLELDQNTPKGQLGRTGTIRKDLYDLVDNGVDCFDRAVDLLETYHRLFVLSRLYQHSKMASDVLGTWKRIIEGEEDAGGELGDGEQRVRGYLLNISNQSLVKEYGVWLAARNPRLGVQVFADDKGKAPKFAPAEAVAILREEAPDAVKYYLEHLVFGRGNTAYVNELITYYLDIVIDDLQESEQAREMVTASYEAYRALQPPKPTYRQFLTDNAPEDDEVWQSRLRLLQLLGGAHDYDATAIRKRIDSSLGKGGKELLVPEAIILDGRARRHEDALRLLVHRLGDYDTAVTYCLRGGSSDSVPTELEEVQRLFRVLLAEFLRIEDDDDREEQTGALLERFGGWFDVLEVLALIPDEWSVDVAAAFLVQALRRLVRERHESMLARSLSGAENLRVNYDLLEKMDEKGPIIDAGN
ncbi:transforming growth factor-beta receptor-associated protein 1 [Diplogelasinospora grovesii]|uniref:Transforming growth factor-beta receptor-associated protein 1 n=1 Tax=Diplogelasinospora grovesii TaxID=303347 RepID=A0AAN6S547_9PEZI|nr:transforming growth factor-beta receptor-associated protein 1 [Diplogelasinospora grovesii]